WVVEEGLERPEAGDPGDQLTDHRLHIGHRRDRSGQAAVVVGADHRLGQATYDERVALRVDTLTAHGLAHPLVERLDRGPGVPVAVRGDHRHRRSPPRVRDPCLATYDALPAAGTPATGIVDNKLHTARPQLAAADSTPPVPP